MQHLISWERPLAISMGLIFVKCLLPPPNPITAFHPCVDPIRQNFGDSCVCLITIYTKKKKCFVLIIPLPTPHTHTRLYLKLLKTEKKLKKTNSLKIREKIRKKISSGGISSWCQCPCHYSRYPISPPTNRGKKHGRNKIPNFTRHEFSFHLIKLISLFLALMNCAHSSWLDGWVGKQ